MGSGRRGQGEEGERSAAASERGEARSFSAHNQGVKGTSGGYRQGGTMKTIPPGGQYG
jgi:hypothetical protein